MNPPFYIDFENFFKESVPFSEKCDYICKNKLDMADKVRMTDLEYLKKRLDLLKADIHEKELLASQFEDRIKVEEQALKENRDLTAAEEDEKSIFHYTRRMPAQVKDAFHETVESIDWEKMHEAIKYMHPYLDSISFQDFVLEAYRVMRGAWSSKKEEEFVGEDDTTYKEVVGEYHGAYCLEGYFWYEYETLEPVFELKISTTIFKEEVFEYDK